MDAKIKVIICEPMRQPYVTNISASEQNLRNHFGGDFSIFANDYGDANVISMVRMQGPDCHINKAAGCKVTGKAIIARIGRTGNIEGLKDDEAKAIYYKAKMRWNT